MKIGIFTDSHYSPTQCNDNRYNSLSLVKIKEALEYFKEQKVDACFCLGDLTDVCKCREDAVRCLDEILELFAEARKNFPIYVAPGNHDYSVWKREDFFTRIKSACPPYSSVIGNRRFIFLDANYDENGNSFDLIDYDWRKAYLSDAQVSWLQEELINSKEECVIVCHEPIDPKGDTEHCIRNRDKVAKILEDSKKVGLVLQGHYHPGAIHTVNSILYITYPAMVEGNDNRYDILSL